MALGILKLRSSLCYGDYVHLLMLPVIHGLKSHITAKNGRFFS